MSFKIVVSTLKTYQVCLFCNNTFCYPIIVRNNPIRINISFSVEDIEKLWLDMYDKFRDCYRKVNFRKSGEEDKNIPLCDYYDQLSFLESHILHRKGISSWSAIVETDTDQETESASKIIPSKKGQRSSIWKNEPSIDYAAFCNLNESFSNSNKLTPVIPPMDEFTQKYAKKQTEVISMVSDVGKLISCKSKEISNLISEANTTQSKSINKDNYIIFYNKFKKFQDEAIMEDCLLEILEEIEEMRKK